MGEDMTRALKTPLRQQGKVDLFKENLSYFLEERRMPRSVVSLFLTEAIFKFVSN